MQSITHEYRNCNELFDFLENLYYLTSDDSWEKSGLVQHSFPKSFEPVLKIFRTYGYSFDFDYRDIEFDEVDVPTVPDKVLVCVSGGKDSIATALYYLNNGYQVELLHIRGLNKCYPDEYKAVENIAKYLNLPLHIERVRLHGNHMYIEHPLKNYMLMNVAIHVGLRLNIQNIALGDFATASLDDNRFDVSGGDCYEMWLIYQDIIQSIMPRFEVLTPLESVKDSLESLVNDPKLLELSQSCIGTFRFREYKGQKVREKFGVNLMPHRCGSCWKCALEYLFYSDHDVIEYNEAYYKHCLEILLKNYIETNNTIPYSIYELWDSYLYYNIDKSKLGGVKLAIIHSREIIYITGDIT